MRGRSIVAIWRDVWLNDEVSSLWFGGESDRGMRQDERRSDIDISDETDGMALICLCIQVDRSW